MSTFSSLDLIQSDMWRWDVLSVSISIPFILMFLTYNCCAKWPLRIVRTFQTCAKRLVRKAFCAKCPVFLAFHNREQIKIHVIVLILRTACKCCFIFLVIGFLFLFLLLFFFLFYFTILCKRVTSWSLSLPHSHDNAFISLWYSLKIMHITEPTTLSHPPLGSKTDTIYALFSWHKFNHLLNQWTRYWCSPSVRDDTCRRR